MTAASYSALLLLLAALALASEEVSLDTIDPDLEVSQAMKESRSMTERRMELVTEGLTPPRRSAAYLHHVNNMVDSTSREADQRAIAFLQLSENVSISRASSPFVSHRLAVDDNEVCKPPIFKCPDSIYRTHDGTCNNPYRPGCGRANSGLLRKLPANYHDGVYQVRRSKSGNPLPSARRCQTTVFDDKRIPSKKVTLFCMQLGQMASHDLALSSTRQTASGPVQCCTENGSDILPPSELSDACLPILVPRKDPFYKRFNIRCMEFVRAMIVTPDDCLLQPAVPMNVVTTYLDLSPVYGNSDQANAGLRENSTGRLAVSIFNKEEFLPQTPNAPLPCNNQTIYDNVCFRGGDVRINQNPMMTMNHVLFNREHNRIAFILHLINPHWDDERIYQETRRIFIACYQHMIYAELVRLLIGPQLFEEHFSNYEYDETQCAGTFVEFTSVAFRYFHTLVNGILKMLSPSREVEAEISLSNFFNRPTIVTKKFKELVTSAATVPSRKDDINFEREIGDELFKPNKSSAGLSLSAFDIQRGRDHGIPSYNDLREVSGLPRVYDFAELTDIISPRSVIKLEELYEHVDDIDAIVGGSLEETVPGALMGPTFLSMMIKQMKLTREADRFHYLNKKQKYPFTDSQLEEIEKVSLARLVCDHTDTNFIQRKALERISHWNPLVPCNDIPEVDLSAWKEY